MTALLDRLLEHKLMPDSIVRIGIRRLLARKLSYEQNLVKQTYHGSVEARERAFMEALKTYPIAIETQAANDQHYEVPAEFYGWVLGKHRKYSSGLWLPHIANLDAAEAAMLDLYCERAQLKDGQTILDLGCGWGSVSLYIAQRYPNSRIIGLSNAHAQRQWIMTEAERQGLTNLTIQTGNIVDYTFEPSQFDRVISVEMFEHMKNYEQLLAKVASWLRPGGKLFVHIFTHALYPYHYEDTNGTDWLARYFFTGGTMPSHNLLPRFNHHLTCVNDWTVSGTHYQQTANAWLRNMDAHRAKILPVFEDTYGPDEALKWISYWRIFFMACAELWGYAGGTEWQVSHYLFEKKPD